MNASRLALGFLLLASAGFAGEPGAVATGSPGAAAAAGNPMLTKQGATAVSHPSVAPDGSVSPQRKFMDLSVHESNVIMNEIKKHDFAFIMNAWLYAGRVPLSSPAYLLQ